MEKKLFFTVTLFITFLGNQSLALVDLEEKISEMIITSKQIIIPDYPHAFNPSITLYQGKLLLSFRVVPNAKEPFTSYLYLVKLNQEFDPIESPILLPLRKDNDPAPCRAEDGRLTVVNDRLYIVYSDNEDEKISKGGFRQYIAEIEETPRGEWVVKEKTKLAEFEGQSQERREKNWTPFNYNNILLLAYSLAPHRIVVPLLNQHKAKTISQTDTSFAWQWGELRGGTPAIRDHDHYIAFFHSSKKMRSMHSQGKEMPHYFMGAYCFEKDWPWKITAISKEPIIGKNFYHGQAYRPYWGSVIALFPAGLISSDSYFWVVYGRQDHELWVTKIDKKKLYAQMVATQ